MSESKFLIEMGKRIYRRRKELHFTQEQVAEAMDLSLQSISCIELGKKAIRPDNLVKLCNVLNVSADYILMGQRSEQQLSKLNKKITSLSDEDMKLVELLVNRLSNQQQ